jgi:DNA-binding transcriptional ArsR family regulator
MPRKKTSSQMCCGVASLGKDGVAVLRSEIPDSWAVEGLADLLAMAGNPVRLHLLLALLRREGLCVCDLAELVGMSSAAVSAHLQKLKHSGVVSSRRDGQMIRYSLVKREELEVLESLVAAVGVRQ